MSGVEVYQLRDTSRSAAWFEVDATNYADFAHSASIYQYRTLYSQATVEALRAQIEAAEARHAATERDACRQAARAEEWHQAAKDRSRELQEALARAEAAEAECARLRSAGTLLANCAFNLAQREHLTTDERRSLDESRIAWDAARTKEETK